MRLSKTTVPKESDENLRDDNSAGTGDVESPIRSDAGHETDEDVGVLFTPPREAVRESALVVEEVVFESPRVVEEVVVESPRTPKWKKKRHPNAGLWE